MAGVTFDWSSIDTVLLDMDGTLLDLEFDNVLWNDSLPGRYAARHGISENDARLRLHAHFDSTRHTIDHYCLDYWARFTRIDLLALHREHRHLIRYRPHASAFLERVKRTGRRVVLVTNAHRASLSLKDEVTRLTAAVHRTVSSHDFVAPKETPDFWRRLDELEPFRADRTLLIDDNAVVLDAARNHGITQLLTVTQPDSARPPRVGLPYAAFNHFDEIMPS